MDEALGLRADGLPSGGALLVTDEVAASGGWLVAHFLRRALADAAAGSEADARGPGSAAGSAEAAPRRAVCLVAADQDLAHYAQALRKLGRNVHAELASGRLVVVDALSLPYDWCRDAAGDAPASTSAPSSAAPGVRAWSAPTDDPVPGRSLFAAVEAALGRAQPSPAGGGGVPPGVPPDGAPARRVVVFDDLGASLPSSASSSPAAASGARDAAAVRALLTSCLALGDDVAVVALAHADAAGAAATRPGGWLAAADALADARVRVRRLDSGAAPDVHGRAAVTHRTGRWMPPCGGRDAPRPPRTAEVRFEITEAGTRVTRA